MALSAHHTPNKLCKIICASKKIYIYMMVLSAHHALNDYTKTMKCFLRTPAFKTAAKQELYFDR